MSRTVFAVVVLSLLAVTPILSQAPSVTTAVETHDAKVVIILQNNRSQPITAFAISATFRGADSGVRSTQFRIIDNVADARDEIVAPGATREVSFHRGGGNRQIDLVELQAALFEDDYCHGSEEWCARLTSRRQTLSENLSDALDLLVSAQTKGLSRNTVLSQLEDLEFRKVSELRASGGNTPEVVPYVMSIYRNLRFNVENMTVDGAQPPIGTALKHTIQKTRNTRGRILARTTEVQK